MTTPRPRIFTIPPSVPFLPTLMSTLLNGRLMPGFTAVGDPLALASATIYLPTRRACRLAHDMFLQTLGGEAALLPKLIPIGEPDEDALIFDEHDGGDGGADDLNLPPAIEPLERRLLLARLILRWAQSRDVTGEGRTPLVAAGPASALKLADDLSRLMDDMITRGAPWSKLDHLVPDHLDEYWRLTLNFLNVIRDKWPRVLEERGRMESAERRDRLLAAMAARLRHAQGDRPIIGAGSTASMPASALLLATIAKLPHGAVVLPGLDVHLDDPTWESLGGSSIANEGRLDGSSGHPQFGIRAFLQTLGTHREEVVPLAVSPHPHRERLVSDAMRPAAATQDWHMLQREELSGRLAGVSVIEAANAEEEALAIAVALREVVEHPGRTAALVTPDRALARRVIAALARWRVVVDDSGGDALADTPAGVFARLSAEVALAGLDPVGLLALLKHPLLRLGAREGAHARAISVLERAVLRGPRPRAGSDGLRKALASLHENHEALHRADPRRNLTLDDLALAAKLARALQDALAPLESLASRLCSLAEIASAHCEVLASLGEEDASRPAFDGRDGTQLWDVLGNISESPAAQDFIISCDEYPEILRGALAGPVVRPQPAAEAQVRIFGLLEARLQQADRIVLGGLVEGVWPPQPQSDPWLSRPMRQALGLDLPERRIGLTAHDFAQALGCPDVVLSRTAKLAGAPTVPSRFVQRIAAVAGTAEWEDARRRGGVYLDLARALDRPTEVRPVQAPAPRPPVAIRPSRLSVTEVEDWLRDPYTIYAKRILRLMPLDPVDTPPGARDRGSAIHLAIEAFTKAAAEEMPHEPLAKLLALGRQHFAPLADFPEAQAFWWPRFERIARWFVDWEHGRRTTIEAVHAEVQGEVEIPLGERSLRLTVRADRIERTSAGAYAILDYKTGQAPTAKQVRSGLAPQLTLEAAILQQGGFPSISRGATVDSITYIRLRGGEPAGEEREIAWNDTSPAAEATLAFTRLVEVAQKFEDVETPYRSLVHPMWRTRYGDYDHLARVKEWAAASGAIDPAAVP